VDAAGLKVDGVKVPDLFAMTPEEVVQHIFAKPETAAALFPADPTPEQMEVMLRQRATLARLAWNPYFHNPKLPRRLGRIRVPTLVVWGEGDKLFPLEIGRAWERAIPGARLTVLENTRFNPGETENDEGYARELASPADLYVNDAFGSAHRAHASTEAVAHLLPAYAGLLLERELAELGKLLGEVERPFVAIVGGLKVEDKVGVLRVAEALRHGARYGAFDHNAVARIITGKHPPSRAPAFQALPAPPVRVAEFLKGAGSHQRGVDTYERLARERSAPVRPATPPPEKEEHDHGQRRDGPTDPAPEATAPAPRGPKPR
jgi:hypothetical protein